MNSSKHIIANFTSIISKWTGDIDADWNKSGNWTQGIPTASLVALIDDVTSGNYPVISSGVTNTCYDLRIYDGSLTVNASQSLNIIRDLISGATINNSGTISIKRHFSNTGTITHGSSSTILLNGDETQEISGMNAHHLTFTGTGNKLVNTTTYISGNLNISTTVNFGTNNIHLTGYSVQNLSSTIDPITFNTLTVNNSYSNIPQIILAGGTNVLIKGHLELTSGVIRTTSSSIITIDNLATSSGGNNTSYVSGPMKRTGSTNFIFPVGDKTFWRRLAITPGGPSTFTAQYYRQPPVNQEDIASEIKRISTGEFWDLSCDSPVSARVSLYWEDSELSGITDPYTLCIAHFNGSIWDIVEIDASLTKPAPNSAGTITSKSYVSSFSPFTFGSLVEDDNPLPVVLLNFTGKLMPDNTVLLEWSTASEFNSNRFELERSTDGTKFEYIGQVKSAGNSTTIKEYSFTDINPNIGNNYYRLRQIDNDGTRKTFKAINVKVDKQSENKVIIYPNPVNDLLTIKYLINDKTTIMIYSSDGSLVKTFETNMEKTEIDVSALTSGIYLIRLVDSNSSVLRFVKE